MIVCWVQANTKSREITREMCDYSATYQYYMSWTYVVSAQSTHDGRGHSHFLFMFFVLGYLPGWDSEYVRVAVKVSDTGSKKINEFGNIGPVHKDIEGHIVREMSLSE